MNYSKRGIYKKQQALHAKGEKIKRFFCVLIMKALLVCFLCCAVIGFCVGFGVFNGIISSSPDISSINVIPTGYASVAYDCEGHEMVKLVAANSNRSYVKMDMIPQDLCDAFVAIEDERFYKHSGIDFKSIMRAAYQCIKTWDLSQGGSTITQQLIKNNVFDNWTNESTMEKIRRKIQEQYLAIELEKVMDKDEILEYYMNSINLGQSTLGVQAASLRYFNKQVYQLNLSECAVIAGITQNPSKYNPITHPDRNAERRERVLKKMLEQDFITQAEFDLAMADDVYSRIQNINQETASSNVYSYFVDELIEQVIEDLTEAGYSQSQAYNLLYSGGLSIYCTYDPQIQSICDDVFTNEDNYPEKIRWLLDYKLSITKKDESVENYSVEMYKKYFQESNPGFNLLYDTTDDAYAAIEEYKAAVLQDGDAVLAESISLTPQPQVSITVEDQNTGYIVAMVGGRGTKEASLTLNRASNTFRQPGSTYKVLSAFAPALDSAGMTLATIQNDAPFNYADGKPVSNWYSTGYRGLTSMRTAIEQSMNICAVKTLTQITPQLGFDYLLNFGFTSLVEHENGHTDIVQALALGGITKGVTNLELNAAYATIADGGTYKKPTLYTKIIDHDGNILLDKTVANGTRVIKETTAFLLTDAMTGVVTKGTGTAARFDGGMAIAGKTGTTSDYKDLWFCGYTPYYTATVWTGYDNNVTMTTSEEKGLSKKLWKLVMQQVHENLENRSFTMPGGIVTATICSQSGKLPIPGLCDADGSLVVEYFADGTVPTETCDVHYQGQVCAYSGLCASEGCPFSTEGILHLTPIEDASLLSGSTITDADGNITAPARTTNMCPHDYEFFQQPNYQDIINSQTAEIQSRQAQPPQ